VVCLFSTFLNRAFDQVLMDVALHRLAVTFVLDRAGLTGDDGPSHHGMWDTSVLGVVPGIRLAAPRDPTQLRELLREAVDDDQGPTVLRFPKGSVADDIEPVGRVGVADVLVAHLDADVLVVAAGPLAAVGIGAATALAAEGVKCTVVDPRWLLPVDPALVALASERRMVVTIEDNIASGGLGDAWARALRTQPRRPDLLTLALPPTFIPQGKRESLLCGYGLDATGVAAAIRNRWHRLAPDAAGRAAFRTLSQPVS
jgi:1-deoxy-D-xylulose-5-phosphate synthase